MENLELKTTDYCIEHGFIFVTMPKDINDDRGYVAKCPLKSCDKGRKQ